MTMPGQHSHKHTHQLVDGNGHPVHEAEEHEHPHADGPTPTASRHHDYVEEPKVAMGPITPGQWLAAGPGPSDEPDEPDHPAYIYVTRGEQEVVIATVRPPLYMVDGADGSYDFEAGDWVANAKLMTFSPALLRFIQSLAAYQGGSGQGQTADEIKERALVLIEQLNAVEVRNDADRW